jgi:hypothetical protein
MRERSEHGFFIAKAHEAEDRAANALSDDERKIWQEIALEYRRLSLINAAPKERPL